MTPAIRIRVGGILSQGTKLLLVCHEKQGERYWLLPGGGVNCGEELEAALLREFLEETSLHIKVGKLLFVNEVISPDASRHGIHFTFLVDSFQGELSTNPDDRLRLAEFVEWERIKEISLRPSLGEFLLKAYRKKFKQPTQFLGNLYK